MTVQELFAKVNREELVNRLDDYCGEEFAEIMLEEFEETAAYGEDKVLTSYDYITNTRCHTGGLLSLADWGAALGAEIDESLFESMSEGFVTAGEAAAHLLNGEHLKDYTPTGLCAVDSIMGGLRKGNLILLAGRPGMGKTQFSLNIAYNAAKASGKKAVFVSYECSSEQIASRALWMLTGISPSVIQGHYGTPLDTLKQRITDAANELGDTPLIVHSADIQTVGQLKNDLMDIDDIGLVVIDYLQLLETDRKLESRIAGT